MSSGSFTSGFPVCVEARGILYNADAIEATLGEAFDPSSIVTLDDFKAFLDRMVEGGMEAPVGILKPDWSLAAHYLQHVYEEHDDVEAFVQALYAGNVNLMKDAKFNALMLRVTETLFLSAEHSGNRARGSFPFLHGSPSTVVFKHPGDHVACPA